VRQQAAALVFPGPGLFTNGEETPGRLGPARAKGDAIKAAKRAKVVEMKGVFIASGCLFGECFGRVFFGGE
jgi:hypothetical protein